MSKKTLTTQEFIKRAIEIHGHTYDYSIVVYVNTKTPVEIICKQHGVFKKTPNSHLSQRSGCPYCSDHVKTSEDVLKVASQIHKHKYRYELFNYVNMNTKSTIICPIHGAFSQSMAKHIYQQTGCPICGTIRAAEKNKKPTLDFIREANIIHDYSYSYDRVKYINTHTPVEIVCPLHGSFFQSPTNHVHSHNENKCPVCSKAGYSQKAIRWLEFIAQQDGIFIQHAENDGEFKIPGTKLKADGYCKATNTIYEFYGDAFHGNLMIYQPNEPCHPYNEKTAKQLNVETKARERFLTALGFNVKSIWENEWDQYFEGEIHD